MKYIVFPAALLMLSLAGCDSASQPPAEAVEEVQAEQALMEQVAQALPEEFCVDAGPQTPRDITNATGLNAVEFPMAPAPTNLNLCNIHTHTHAEHKGPGFSVFVGDGNSGGNACNDAASLTAEELADPTGGEGAYKGVKPGDTIEVHWVYSSCDVDPGKGLGACLAEGCDNPLFRVEAQAFLVVNDPNAINFMDYAYSGCTLDVSSLHVWAEVGNVFEETKSHGVRQLVTEPRLLSPIN